MTNRNALLRLVVLGLAVSRDQYWQKTSEPTTSVGSTPLWMRALKLKLNAPVQSEPLALPPEFCDAVRRIGDLTHNVPPWNAAAFGACEYISRPLVWLSTLAHVTLNAAVEVALAVPVLDIEGVQPRLFVLPVQ
jgi:hypothetical protein